MCAILYGICVIFSVSIFWLVNRQSLPSHDFLLLSHFSSETLFATVCRVQKLRRSRRRWKRVKWRRWCDRKKSITMHFTYKMCAHIASHWNHWTLKLTTHIRHSRTLTFCHFISRFLTAACSSETILSKNRYEFLSKETFLLTISCFIHKNCFFFVIPLLKYLKNAPFTVVC